MINYDTINTAFVQLVGYHEQQNVNITPEATAGTLIIGDIYEILDYKTDDNFINVAQIISGTINTTGCIFVATGTTPTKWINLSKLKNITLLQSDSGVFVNDIEGVDLLSIEKTISIDPSTLLPEKTVKEYLQDIYEPTLKSAIDDFITFAAAQIPQNLEKYNQQTEINNDAPCFIINNFEGVEINLAQNTTITIKKIGAKIDKSQTLRLFCYDITKKTAIYTEDLILTANNYDFADVNWVLPSLNSDNIYTHYIIGFFNYNYSTPETWQLQPDTNINFNYSQNNGLTGCNVSEITDYDCPQKENLAYSEMTPLIFTFEWQKDYTGFLVSNKLALAKLFGFYLAKKIINDCLYSKEFNSISESNRLKWERLILNYRNIINGYEFKLENSNGYQKGVRDDLLSLFQSFNDNLFPKPRKLVL